MVYVQLHDSWLGTCPEEANSYVKGMTIVRLGNGDDGPGT